MAVQNVKSSVITDLDATPIVHSNRLERAATLYEAAATIAFTATQAGGDANSVWRFLRIPARARIHKLEIANDDLDSGAGALAVNVGLYEVEGGAAKDADFFASAITNLQAAAAFQDETYESAVVGIEKQHQAIWQQLGDADTPANRDKEYDIAMTVTTAAGTGAAGDVTMRVLFSLPE